MCFWPCKRWTENSGLLFTFFVFQTRKGPVLYRRGSEQYVWYCFGSESIIPDKKLMIYEGCEPERYKKQPVVVWQANHPERKNSGVMWKTAYRTRHKARTAISLSFSNSCTSNNYTSLCTNADRGKGHSGVMVGRPGFEPGTSWLRVNSSANWANAPITVRTKILSASLPAVRTDRLLRGDIICITLW